jgi:hypothetical protein
MTTRLLAWLCPRKTQFRSCRFLPEKGQKGPMDNALNRRGRFKNVGIDIQDIK